MVFPTMNDKHTKQRKQGAKRLKQGYMPYELEFEKIFTMKLTELLR